MAESNSNETSSSSGDESITSGNNGLVERVRKLMAKAEASDNPHEAEAFATKAADLVARHRIDPSRLRVIATHDRLVVREIPLGRGAYVRCRLALLTSVAEAHDARVVFGTTPEGTVAYVAGFSTDLDVVEVMYHSLHTQVAAHVATERRSTAAATQRFRRSFMFGFAQRVGVLLQSARQAAEADISLNGGDDVLPAVLERTRQVDVFLEQSVGRVRAARPAAGAEAGGWRAGVAAAEGAEVGRRRLAGRRAIGPG